MIEPFLRQLADALPGDRRARRRILVEVEDHLRTAAAEAERRGLSRDEAEAEAVRRFGDVRTVAAGFGPLALATALRRAALALLAALLVAFPVAYGLTENLLPPATWVGDEPPPALRWKRGAVAFLAAVAAAAAVVAYVLARLGRVRLAGAATGCAAAALALGAGVATVLAVQWSEQVPGAGRAFLAAGAVTAALIAPAVALGLRAALEGRNVHS
ncbi:MAG: hypothetical protein ICV59_08700 [Thermoleophilia bacterium]|nr:hypothetical protein [Thermoleophilia bacterium]